MPEQPARNDPALDLAAQAAVLLLENGQTTEGTLRSVDRIGRALGVAIDVFPSWGLLSVRAAEAAAGIDRPATPAGVDIGRVAAAEAVIDEVVADRMGAAEALDQLHALRQRPPVSLLRLTVMAALGAAALAVIFGATDSFTLAVIAASAGLGGALRRVVSHLSSNAFAQPFAASLLAGTVSSICIAGGLPIDGYLVAVCPCMVLVPGPHVLNGAIDLVRNRLLLGLARLAFATMVVIAICAGLLLGLSISGAPLAAGESRHVVPLAADVGAAAIAVAAYGAFFNMPWRTLALPIAIGMLAHALRWWLLSLGWSVPLGAFAACVLVGVIVAILAHRLRLPFAALAFASVVSMIPGVYFFQAASQALLLVGSSPGESASIASGMLTNATTAFLVVAAMTMGLIVPKLCIDQILSSPGAHGRPAASVNATRSETAKRS